MGQRRVWQGLVLVGSGVALVALSGFGRGAATEVTLPYPAGQLLALDPMDWSANILVDQGTLFEGLYGYNRANQIVPKIALRSTSSDGGQVWTIDLRHNARWSNGKPVTAYDFYDAWMRILSPKDGQGALFAGITNDIQNGYAYHAGTVSASQVGLWVLGRYQLRVRLNLKTNIEGLLVESASMPVYPPVVKAHPNDWYDPRYFVGDGPYVVHAFVPNGTLVLTRNRDYVGHAGEWNVGNVEKIRLIPEPSVATEAYLGGELDVAPITSGSSYAYARRHLAGQIRRAPEAALWYLGYDHSVLPSALDNLDVRRAIALAISRGPLVNPGMSGLVAATTVFAYPGFPTAGLEHNPDDDNRLRAKRLLARAGYAKGRGLPTILLYIDAGAGDETGETVTAEVIAQQLHQTLGLGVEISSVNAAVYSQMEYGGTLPGVMPGYTLDEAVATWNQEANWPLGSDQWISLALSGTVGSPSFQRHARLWDFYPNDPHDVALWGSPSDPKMGTTYRQWQPLVTAAEHDVLYLQAWLARQPQAYQRAVDPSGRDTLRTALHRLIAGYARSRTPSQKHRAWVRLWRWVGTSKNEDGRGAQLGLNAQVYVDRYEPGIEYEVRLWQSELDNTDNLALARQLSAKIADAVIASGYAVPLYYQEMVYLQNPQVRGVQANPWAELGFYQFQYLQVKSAFPAG